jgi:uncharacterized protein (TIGR02145 family)
MAQNLIELPNGVPINTGQSLSAAGNTSTGDLGYYGFYNPGGSVWALTAPAADEGMLYQWSAAMMGATTERAKGACPSGWHIPSDCEWLYVEHGLGLSLANQAAGGESRGNATTDGNVASKLSSKVPSGTNSSGFSGLIAGRLQGGFSSRGGTASYWTSTASSATSAYTFAYKSNITGTVRGTDTKNLAFSVRCLKD